MLFDATVRENIKYGKPDATDKEVEAVVRVANAVHFVTDLSQGLDTQLGELGIRLSGG